MSGREKDLVFYQLTFGVHFHQKIILERYPMIFSPNQLWTQWLVSYLFQDQMVLLGKAI